MALNHTESVRAARALAHPLRARVLQQFIDRPGSPSEVAALLDAPLSTISYHVRILAGLGFLELTGTTPRRGALEHTYRATARITLNVQPLEQNEQYSSILSNS